MADAIIVKTHPTNPHWDQCGPPHPDVKALLEGLSDESKKHRIDWLQTLCNTPLPSGPYPFHVVNRGWFKGYIYDERYQACYVMREDLNLDITIFEVMRSPAGIVLERVPVTDQTLQIRIRIAKVDLWAVYKRQYPREFKEIPAVWEFANVTAASLLSLIFREAELWREYDLETMDNLSLMKRVQHGPAQCAAICRGDGDTFLLRRAILADHTRLQVNKRLTTTSRPSRAKRCLPFTDKAVRKRPKVRFVSKLDKADAALNQVNKQIGSTLWLIEKLKDNKAFKKTVAKKPKKIAGAMFKLLPKEDLVKIAVQLAQNCALDSLEEVLHAYRRKAHDVARTKYNEHVQQSIVANINLSEVRKETELGPNAVDALPMEQCDVGPDADGPQPEGDGPEPKGDGPDPEGDGPEPKGDGPDPEGDGPEPEGDGPEPKGDTEDLTTPSLVAREHWIPASTSRSTTGYKGVCLERSSGRYRIKHNGNTINRQNTLEEACSWYYNWSVRNGFIKDFRLV